MSADIFHFVIEQGSDWVRQVVIKNDDGTVINLAGATAQLQVRSAPANTQTVISLSTADGSMTLDGPNGKLKWSMSGAQTAAIAVPAGLPIPLGPKGSGYLLGGYDLLVKDASGRLIKYLTGNVYLIPDYTRPF
ncbi:hypothetical protein [Paraburkholderia diazotrophica]|uniref:Uncharacterized protein n=1 Tax=Paraburkholderia diazotrophica TaxID=667676 RepID=A0A1H6QGT7_9BURK|nr:hypothetical protein [Paraburkholderia diazotrophica]SEI42918.1 hypothetical protein SAMN05192539_1001339 [Paraburkholderia diazotrophica]